MNSVSPPEPWIGRSIGDRQRYRLDKRLGAGGMGEVFLAMDTIMGRQVALKLLKDNFVRTMEVRKRFEREVQICAALKSENIVQVTDYGVEEEYPFYVMEYLRGKTLGQLLDEKKRLDVQQAVEIISQVCDGLELAHQGLTLWLQGATVSEHVVVVHRDLKPENIFLVPKPIGELVKILDFGIAKIRSDQIANDTLTNTFIGTFQYAAPEQLEVDKNLDGRADIYSLGVILYEMLSGTDAFDLGLNIRPIGAMAWFRAHLQALPLPLRSQPGCERLSPELEEVVMRCLDKTPDRRFSSVGELKQALQNAVRVNYSPAPRTIIQPSRPKKFPLLLAGAGIAITVAATGAAYIHWQSSASENKAQLTSPFPSPIITNEPSPEPTSSISDHEKSINEIKTLLAQGNYEECIAKAQIVAKDSSLNAETKEILNQCQIEQAKKLAAASEFAKAMKTVSTISPDSHLYAKAQQLLEQWSDQTITVATEQFQAGKLDTAIAQVKTIPANSPLHQKAQAAIDRWRLDWHRAENQFNLAHKALDEENWQLAITESNQVPDIAFWQNKIKAIVTEANSKIAAAESKKIPENPPLQIPDSSLSKQESPPPKPDPNSRQKPILRIPKDTWEHQHNHTSNSDKKPNGKRI